MMDAQELQVADVDAAEESEDVTVGLGDEGAEGDNGEDFQD